MDEKKKIILKAILMLVAYSVAIAAVLLLIGNNDDGTFLFRFALWFAFGCFQSIRWCRRNLEKIGKESV